MIRSGGSIPGVDRGRRTFHLGWKGLAVTSRWGSICREQKGGLGEYSFDKGARHGLTPLATKATAWEL